MSSSQLHVYVIRVVCVWGGGGEGESLFKSFTLTPSRQQSKRIHQFARAIAINMQQYLHRVGG